MSENSSKTAKVGGGTPVGGRGIDDIDRKILDALQHDSDRPVSEIADEVNLSSTPCWRRIRRLEELGFIKPRVALADRRQMNVAMTVFVGVKAPRHQIDWLDDFRKLIENTPEVVEAYRLTGETDYLIKIVVPNIEVYDTVYKRMISKLEFSDFNSSISMEEMKFTTAVTTKYI